jgi:2,3-dihydroxybenzoate decarboxylase
MLLNASSYWQTNLYETTSGNFATPLLHFHISQIGLDRILYSVDYPFVTIAEGAAWVDGLALDQGDLTALKRGLAIDLFKLND